MKRLSFFIFLIYIKICFMNLEKLNNDKLRDLSTSQNTGLKSILYEDYSSFSKACENTKGSDPINCFLHKYSKYWCCSIENRLSKSESESYCTPFSDIVAKSKIKEYNSYYKYTCEATNILIFYSIAIIYFLLYI